MKQSKNLGSLIVKHFSFLTEDYDFVYSESLHRYSKPNLEFEIQHQGGELKLFFIKNKKRMTFEESMSEVRKEYFSYPAHFTNWVLSMGDVDSRLAYDAKLIKTNATKLLY